MILSKPLRQNVLDFASFYLQNLYLNPLRTKSITSCMIASLGNFTSQVISSGVSPKAFNQHSLIAFALFGFLFSGPLPHFFYNGMEKLYPSTSVGVLLKFLTERLMFAPFYQAFSLYSLARLERKTHEEAVIQLKKLFWPVLKANWQFWTLLQFINMTFVPPMFRVLFVNAVGFFWTIYLAMKRRQDEEMKRRKEV